MYQLFYDSEEPPKLPKLPKRKTADDIAWGSKGKDARLLAKFCRLFSRMEEGNLGWFCSWHRKWRDGRDTCTARFERATVLYDVGLFNNETRAWVIPADVEPVLAPNKNGSYSHYDPKTKIETVHFKGKAQ